MLHVEALHDSQLVNLEEVQVPQDGEEALGCGHLYLLHDQVAGEPRTNLMLPEIATLGLAAVNDELKPVNSLLQKLTQLTSLLLQI